MDTCATVVQLVSGKKYQFRVKAVNEELEGPPRETDIIEVKEPAGNVKLMASYPQTFFDEPTGYCYRCVVVPYASTFTHRLIPIEVPAADGDPQQWFGQAFTPDAPPVATLLICPEAEDLRHQPGFGLGFLTLNMRDGSH